MILMMDILNTSAVWFLIAFPQQLKIITESYPAFIIPVPEDELYLVPYETVIGS